MDGDAEILRFGQRGWDDEWRPPAEPWDEDVRYGVPTPAPSRPWDALLDEVLGEGASGRAPSGRLTQVVLVGDRVVDVVRRPVAGSEYECVALELEDERRRHRQPPPLPEPPGHEKQLDWLARVVGGVETLMSLDTEPLPAEPVDFSAVSLHLRDRAAALDARLAEVVPRLLGDEALTAARRLLVRALGNEPGVLTRSDRDDIAAGAVVWAVGRGNDLVGPNRPVRSTTVSDALGLRSSPSQRGEAFARAAGGGGVAPWAYHRAEPDVIPLGDPGLLLARFRRRVVATRDLALALRARTPRPG
ncbi:hypothetical protein JQN72_11910 [Phycicoccus sp. CSK15P-2]|uniref:hypothetical protein n=1 Tax=Phycicoccus sp. CSK15P-2 TaxID=2807627 RepID=UPI00194EF7D8|nr:hypothetical protein [Phycicoccus sp. CSK15P-2]MBM6404947.1 hypothetical protein [Phycicoccus sp. CSK15P-2]